MDQLDILSSPFLRIPAGIFMVIGVVLFVRRVYEAIRAFPGVRMDTYLDMISLLYMIGLGCKFAAIGPEFFRYHLTDIGFPVAIGLLLFSLYERGLVYNDYFRGLDQFHKALMIMRHKRTFVLIALGLSYAYEIGVELMYQSRPGVTPSMVGRFDWQDMLMYTLGAGLGLAIIQFCLSQAKRWVQERDEAQAALRVAERAHANAVNNELRKNYRSNKRKGNRK